MEHVVQMVAESVSQALVAQPKLHVIWKPSGRRHFTTADYNTVERKVDPGARYKESMQPQSLALLRSLHSPLHGTRVPRTANGRHCVLPLAPLQVQ